MNKVYNNAQEAIQGIKSNMTIMFGGFGLCGIPENCLKALAQTDINGLTCISNNAGIDGFGLGSLLRKHQIRKMIASYVGENKEFERQLLSKELDGIPAFYVPAGYGTEVAINKEVRIFNGKMHLLEFALTADFAIVKAWKGDTAGNLIYKATANNFNNMMAAAGKITIAEVEELVPIGELDPNQIHTPGIFVQRIFKGTDYEKRIEFRTVK